MPRPSKPARMLVGAALLCFCPEAHAEGTSPRDGIETAQLTYHAPTTPACPDDESFRHQVAARLGYEAFTADGKHRVSVALRVEHGRLRGRAEVTRQGQAAPGIRELDAQPDQCEAVVTALATAVAIALDPVRSMQPAVTPAPAMSSAPQVVIVREVSTPAPTPPPAEKKEETPGPRVTLFGAADGVVSFALTPATAVGGQAGVGVRVGAVSVEASGRIETTTEPVRLDSGDRVEATVFSGLLSPCANLGPWLGCLTGRVGAFQGRAPDVVNPNLGTSVFGAVGARAGYVLAVSRVVSFRALGFVELPIVRTALVIDRATVWTAPPVMGGLALGAVFSVP